MRKTSLATGRDIGKMCVFFDNPDEEYKSYGILLEVDITYEYPYTRDGDYSTWAFARRLTEEEKKELI